MQLEIKGQNLFEFQSAEWIRIYHAEDLTNVNENLYLLDKGELEAISIAIKLHADLLIIDEKSGRAIATSIGFDVTGLMGILIIAKKKVLSLR